jgi:hypothetical protein
VEAGTTTTAEVVAVVVVAVEGGSSRPGGSGGVVVEAAAFLEAGQPPPPSSSKMRTHPSPAKKFEVVYIQRESFGFDISSWVMAFLYKGHWHNIGIGPTLCVLFHLGPVWPRNARCWCVCCVSVRMCAIKAASSSK